MDTLQNKLIPLLNKESGLIELVDPISGNVVRVQKTKERILDESELVKILLPDGRTIWAETNVNLDKIPGVQVAWAYSDVIAGLICQEVANGKTLKKVCETKGFPPYSIVCVWRRLRPEFAKMLLDAKKDWAESQHDEAMEIIDNVTEDQDAINKAKARVDFRKWAAERAAPDTYGTKKESGASGGTVILINTGITRPGDPGFRDVTPDGRVIEGQKNESSNHSEDHSRQGSGVSGNESSTGGGGVISIESSNPVGSK